VTGIIGSYDTFGELETALLAATIGEAAVLNGTGSTIVGIWQKIGASALRLITPLWLNAVSPGAPQFTITAAGGGGDFEVTYGSVSDVAWDNGGLRLHNRVHLVLTALGFYSPHISFFAGTQSKFKAAVAPAFQSYVGIGTTWGSRASSLVGGGKQNTGTQWWKTYIQGPVNAQLNVYGGVLATRFAGNYTASYVQWPTSVRYAITDVAANKIHGTGGLTVQGEASPGQFYEPLPTAASGIASASDHEIVVVCEDKNGPGSADMDYVLQVIDVGLSFF
jgi:hypothetical protein